MARKLIRVGVQLDKRTDSTVEAWADREGRSKRRHLSIIVRKLVDLLENRPGELERLGLCAKGQPD